jgi:class 3 adenylate cyclase
MSDFLINENKKLKALIANVFPENIADELMNNGKVANVKYDFVTVMFSDIHEFTRIAETITPEILVDELNKLFSIFDFTVEKYGIEKIKTIGDAYMCAGGIPEKNITNPVMVVLAGLEIMAYMRKLKQEEMKFWNIKIGIHTGPVVAGVMGQKRLSYDIWGDTVNTANHIESAGEAGKINISETTYKFVKDFFDCTYRGKMPVKYKGELDIYIVNGIKPELCDNDTTPNQNFWEKIKKHVH